MPRMYQGSIPLVRMDVKKRRDPMTLRATLLLLAIAGLAVAACYLVPMVGTR